MKILHFNVFKHLLPGIKHQLIDEQHVAQLLPTGIEWSTIVYSLDPPTLPFMMQANIPKATYLPKRLINYLSLKIQAYSWLLENQHRYDVILLRYSTGDPFLLLNAKRLERFITVHHTLEHHEALAAAGIIGYLHSKFDQVAAPYILNKTIGIIAVTNEIRRYEIERTKYNNTSTTSPNGIVILPSTHLVDKRTTKKVKIAFIASTFLPWHGLDIVLEQFKSSDLPVELEIIGQVSQALRIDDKRLTYHGTLDKEGISLVLNDVDIGLSCFALERKGMTEACTLKVREYLNNGIPVYANHDDSALPNDFPYYINQSFSLEHAYIMANKFKSLSRQQIRDASTKFIDKKNQMDALVIWIKSTLVKQYR
ncbi:MAG: hypothetical protein JKY42_00075 [Flavobacteriales bacterium]|nr:hypothetical protein [Flavobacteriales bacterium]